MKEINEYKEMLLAKLKAAQKDAKKLNLHPMELRGVLAGIEVAQKIVEESDPE